MKSILWLVCLCLACRATAGELATNDPEYTAWSHSELGGHYTATGGLADTALSSADLGDNYTRRITRLFDPMANPNQVFQISTNHSRPRNVIIPGRPPLTDAEIEKSIERAKAEGKHFFSTSIEPAGVEAWIILEYYDSTNNRHLSVTIYRYKTVEALEEMWKRSRGSGAYNVTNLAGEEIAYTKGVEASGTSVEEKIGRYHVMLTPGKPEQDDPGLSFMQKQVAKIREIN